MDFLYANAKKKQGSDRFNEEVLDKIPCKFFLSLHEKNKRNKTLKGKKEREREREREMSTN